MPPAPFRDLQALLRELEQEGQAHDAAQSEHRNKRLNLEAPTARLLQLLLLSGRRRRVLEIGTSNGFSALWIADALRRIPGARPLITIERDPARAEAARRNLARAALDRWADVRLGDATAIVAGLEGPFDAVFFDADRVSAPGQLALLLPRLEEDVLLLADNALSHPQEIAGYLEAVERLPGFVTTVVTVGKGLHLAHRIGAPPATRPARAD
ncbi:methyltransferase [Acidobacteria bacterium AB60]|nr:methyltransferase [Acidobacteria bacterium AB60]